jgi:hypothetical protein
MLDLTDWQPIDGEQLSGAEDLMTLQMEENLPDDMGAIVAPCSLTAQF